MSVEDRVIALIDEGNPIPDPNDLDRDRLDAAAYFATLEQRSSNVPQLQTKAPKKPKIERRPAKWIAVAIAVFVVAIGAYVFLGNQGSEVVTPDPESVINQFVTAVDYDTLTSAVTPSALLGLKAGQSPRTSSDSVDEDVITDQLAADAILGVELNVESCEQQVETVYLCVVSYRSSVTMAFDQPAIETSKYFTVVDGLITAGIAEFYAGPLNGVLGTFPTFARDTGIEDGFLEACPETYDLVPACATFMMENLNAWVAWEMTNQ